LQEKSREEKSSEKEIQKGRLSIQTGGDIPTGGVILFPMMSKEKRKKKA
jgi:hypothetical protein